jgi:acyl-CoA thioesterase
MHVQFLRPCQAESVTLKVKPIKLGPLVSVFQVDLMQRDKLCCLALITSGNFDQAKGLTMRSETALQPPPVGKPNLKAVEAHKVDKNWVAYTYKGDLVPITRRFHILSPRTGYPIKGIADNWYRLRDNLESFHPTFLALMADILPSMADTLLNNHSVYDGTNNINRANDYIASHPSSPPLAPLSNTIEDAMKGDIFSFTTTMDVEFRRKVPEDRNGLDWLFVRTATDGVKDGRLYVENMLCDEEGEVVVASRQLILVLEAARKFQGSKASL